MSFDQSPANKMMAAAPSKKAFSFPGDGIWHPVTIEAETRDEAERLYHSLKRLISEPEQQSTPSPQKAEQTTS